MVLWLHTWALSALMRLLVVAYARPAAAALTQRPTDWPTLQWGAPMPWRRWWGVRGADRCGRPPQVQFASVSSDGESLGSRADYSCVDGYRLALGHAHSDCTCAAGRCAWSTPPRCVLQLESPIGAMTRWAGSGDAQRAASAGACRCDPARHQATDVVCRLASSAPFLSGVARETAFAAPQLHRHIRVLHVRGATTRRHHRCGIVPSAAGGECQCCDCARDAKSESEQQGTSSNGCPCGASQAFFRKMWRIPNSPDWWIFKPVPGTKTCAVRGEVRRGGLSAAAGADGDIFALGRVGIKHGRLSFLGRWVKPSDRVTCPDAMRGANAKDAGAQVSGIEIAATDVWRYLARNEAGCGPMSFFIGADKLEGAWRPGSWPAQESWDVAWAAPSNGALGPRCSATASAAAAGIPTCASLRSNTLLRIPVPRSCILAQNNQFDLAASPGTATGL